ncbi:predicted protein [Sclerotinia sclerotiorum 1980 UF-70]|uniref:Uncharacterized protein n=1 Tax=Sclerotinia sclerotiorum (strain ATCC 18683 / 1980 / Ss-1) TaxID=665079 RepID=A7F1M5_SCLS1|nr:predicted protein [Sclerotinia sclerotiorum 1980 UF-70]EDN95617.1 predicted protein [Sclerotinia sclerotiorum 1980 UF-70]
MYQPYKVSQKLKLKFIVTSEPSDFAQSFVNAYRNTCAKFLNGTRASEVYPPT